LRSKNGRQRLLWGIVTLWFASVLVALFWLLDARLSWFDNQGRLQQQVAHGEVEERLKPLLERTVGDLSAVVVHVFSEGCPCNWRTRSHQQLIQRRVTERAGRNVELDIAQHEALKAYIPSTPAVIIFDDNEQLIYLGPYADGAFCNTESSFVEALLPQLSAGTAAPKGGWINTVAKGCYCAVAI